MVEFTNIFFIGVAKLRNKADGLLTFALSTLLKHVPPFNPDMRHFTGAANKASQEHFIFIILSAEFL